MKSYISQPIRNDDLETLSTEYGKYIKALSFQVKYERNRISKKKSMLESLQGSFQNERVKRLLQEMNTRLYESNFLDDLDFNEERADSSYHDAVRSFD